MTFARFHKTPATVVLLIVTLNNFSGALLALALSTRVCHLLCYDFIIDSHLL